MGWGVTALFTIYELGKLYKEYKEYGKDYKLTYLKKAGVILAKNAAGYASGSVGFGIGAFIGGCVAAVIGVKAWFVFVAGFCFSAVAGYSGSKLVERIGKYICKDGDLEEHLINVMLPREQYKAALEELKKDFGLDIAEMSVEEIKR